MYILTGLLLAFFAINLNFHLSNMILPGYLFYDVHRLLELGLLTLAACHIILVRKQRIYWVSTFLSLPKSTRYALSCFLLIGLLSASLAAVPKAAFIDVSLYALLFILSITVSANYVHKQRFNYLLIFTIVIGTLIYSIIFFSAHISDLLLITKKHPATPNVVPGFLNIRFFAQYQCWTLLIVSLPVYLCRSKILKTGAAVLAAIWWSICIFAKTKGLWISLIAAILILLSCRNKAYLKWALQQITLATLGIIIYWLLFHVLSGRLTTYHFKHYLHLHHVDHLLPSITARLMLWQQAIQMAIHHPLLGVGPMHFSYMPSSNPAHPHNSILLILAEWGSIATLLLLFVIYSAYRSLFSLFCKLTQEKSAHDPNNIIFFALLTTVLAGCIYSCISGVIVMPLSQVMMAITVGALLGCYRLQKQTIPDYPTQSVKVYQSSIIVLSVIIAIGALGYGTLPGIHQLPKIEITYFEAHYPRPLPPRFWTLGWIQLVFKAKTI